MSDSIPAVPAAVDPIRGTASGRAPVPLSVLDLATVTSGSDAGAALRITTEVARTADRLGYHRLWVAEHHSMPGIASSAPAVLLAHLGAVTGRIRLGSGGVMLPNHAPLVIAEQFGTLEALHPGRIDLGLGRAPGSDRATAAALRRNGDPGADDFDVQLDELVSFLDDSYPPHHPYARIHAVPGVHQSTVPGGVPGQGRPPVWLLGSSGYSARLAGELGLPFAFAHHFAAQNTLPALELYRQCFTPSSVLDSPYAMIAASVVACETPQEAHGVVRAMGLAMLRVRTGRPGLMPSPQEAVEHSYTAAEAQFVDAWSSNVVYGDPAQVRDGIDDLVDRTGVDELMLAANIPGHDARVRSLELIAGEYRFG